MTDQDPTAPGSRERHFIVIVPGYMGSKLRDKHSGEIIWGDFSSLIKNPLKLESGLNNLFDSMVYPNDDLEPAGILDQVTFLLPWAKQDHYGRLLLALDRMGYRIEPQNPDPNELAVYTFAYDWRQDNRISARQLGEAVQRWRSQHNGAKAWLIGHSNGGIVSRWYIEKEGGKEDVGRLFLMGSPWDGAPKTLRVLTEGMTVFGLKKFNLFGAGQRIKDLIRTFPSYYQIIPYTNPFMRDENNQVVDLFADPSWLSKPVEREYLQDALKFNRDLGTDLSVDSVCFFGRGKPTSTSAQIRRGAGGDWLSIAWTETEAGDGTVPERSAVHPKARARYAFAVDHGSIYVDPQALPQLQWELIGQYRLEQRAILVSDEYTIQFEPEGDIFSPGERIPLWATLKNNLTGAPVEDAQITVQISPYAPLAGRDEPPAVQPTYTTLFSQGGTPGRYTGGLDAPQPEGYYRLQAAVIAGSTPFVLEELVGVEGDAKL